MSISLNANNDGSGSVQTANVDAIQISAAQAVTIPQSLTVTGAQTIGGNLIVTGTVSASGGIVYPLVAGTAVASTSGTSIDFTSIPSWVRRITLMLNGVSQGTGSTGFLLIQIGAGSIETSGYSGTGTRLSGGVSNSVAYTNGLGTNLGTLAAFYSGHVIFTNVSGNIWVGSLVLGGSDTSTSLAGTTKTLSGTLDRIRLTTTTGTDTFDAGSINILYE